MIKEQVNVKLLQDIYRNLFFIRRVEEEIIRRYPTDEIKSPVHLSIGQEAVSVGVCQALKPEDIVFGTYRGHALYLAKGGSLKKMIAELYGKITGCAKGKGGSMHLVDKQKGMMGTSAIVATTIPVSVGYAYGLKYKNSSSIVVSFFGDGAVDEGVFHESINFAVLKKLPIMFVCENNFYAIHSHHLRRHSSDNIWQRVEKYGLPSEKISSGDVLEIYEKTLKYTEQIRKGHGPVFLECDTYRWKEHVGVNDDFELGYRRAEEATLWIEKDPLKVIRQIISSDDAKRIEEEIEKEISAAFIFAQESPFPEASQLYEDVFKE